MWGRCVIDEYTYMSIPSLAFAAVHHRKAFRTLLRPWSRVRRSAFFSGCWSTYQYTRFSLGVESVTARRWLFTPNWCVRRSRVSCLVLRCFNFRSRVESAPTVLASLSSRRLAAGLPHAHVLLLAKWGGHSAGCWPHTSCGGWVCPQREA